MIRLFAIVLGAALLLSGCSTAEGTRAQALLQQAEAAQAKLQSATFEANVGVVMDGEQVDLALKGAASKQGAAFSMHATGIPEAEAIDVQMVLRGNRAWVRDGSGTWESMPVPQDAKRLNGSMGSQAFQELARYVKDVRVAEHQQIGGKSVTTISGEIDTVGVVRAITKLDDSLSGVGGQNTPFTFDLDALGLKIGDIKAVLSIDESTHLLDSALVTLALEAQGKKVEFELRYRLTSANEPVELPAPPG